MIKTYFSLTKPGIILGNLISAAAGFFLASKGNPQFVLFLATMLGISLVIACACVVNNYIDRGIDEKMTRTKNRALVKKTISVQHAIIYAIFLGLTGFYLLAAYTNLLTVMLGLTAFFVYVILYGISKRRSIHGTLIGSISGALPPVAGYTAVTNHLDIAALILFAILTTWQMPHFYAIAMYRKNEYANAGLPVLPVKKGMYITKINIILYIILFALVSSLLTVFNYTGYIYFLVAVVVSIVWLVMAIKGFKTNNNSSWARKMFIFSLITLLLLCITMSLNVRLA